VGLTPTSVLILTSVAFAIWHVSSAVLDRGFISGVAFGLLRWISGSVVVSSVSHGLWNGMVYILFGTGAKVGTLGVAHTAVFGPESGILGLAANIIFAGGLWLYRRAIRQKAREPAN
jgi:membrane protease YdiL (CAAX protease family)